MDPFVLYFAYRYWKNRRKRRWSVHPYNSARYLDGGFRNLFGKLREDCEQFSIFFGMSPRSYDELVVKFQETIPRRPGVFQGLSFSLQEMLAITLRYLGSGCTYTELHHTFRIGVSTAAFIVSRTCLAILISLKKDVFPKFTEELWYQSAEEFKNKAQFSQCIGAIGVKHARMIYGPSINKKGPSIVLLAVADSNYRFLYVDVGLKEEASDPTLFQDSEFGKAFEQHLLNIPKPQRVFGYVRPLPFVFVANGAFEISENMMRPYPGRYLSEKQQIFNYRLSKAQIFIDSAFSILTNKFHIFHRTLNLKFSNCAAVIKTSCALHNYICERDGVKFEDTLEIIGLYNEVKEKDQLQKRGDKSAYKLRNEFADYFCSPEGSVPWQTNIRKGC